MSESQKRTVFINAEFAKAMLDAAKHYGILESLGRFGKTAEQRETWARVAIDCQELMFYLENVNEVRLAVITSLPLPENDFIFEEDNDATETEVR